MNIKNGIFAITFLTVCFFISACSSTNPEMTGQRSGEQNASQTEPSDEDQVLQLLGIPKAGEEESNMDSVMKEKDEMEQKVKKLESELLEKNATISQLVKEVENKEKQLNEREKLLIDLQPAQPSKTSDYESAYQFALSEYMARDYKTALLSFDQLLQNDTGNHLSDNCQYWIGECYYGLGEFQTALIEFEKVANFINSNKEDAAQLKIGFCYEKLGQMDSAKQAFQRLLDKFPNSEFAATAQQMLVKFQ